ncbi:uncharacterized protein si:dkey-9i23.16 [Boleophthalmus pectinirostris]|uniref:uncharacterized protein si:dkey-9i23.16 n=1 Tax=Boleophthalmus pectinirostris TaxID=150288 RepID=UPI00242E07CB|nr:uncharacterized protein si:dkey-9i23.16 [Boleophthalmus pectinirostris]XP_055013824.1 uncharacterized protein si:dkey-9i23.16 [Boleophthalmus pectinirostris]XP_055013825.1 uncharacterized protein si:dkey-9i23.16 [Boleophthalmus pectinirostris]
MSSEGTAPPPDLPITQRMTSWFDHESAAVVTILFGLFQVLLSVPLVYAAPIDMPKFFVLPLFIGILIVTGGSLAMANERSPNRYLLQGCVCSNIISLLGAVIAFCLYCVSISNIPKDEDCISVDCPLELLMKYCMSILILLVFYDAGAIIMNSILSVMSLRELKRG